MPENYFRDLLAVECATDSKNGLTYVSWIEAWTRLKGKHPAASYEVHRTEAGGFVHGEGFVMVSVTVPGAVRGLEELPDNMGSDVTHTMWLPVMDHRNKAIPDPDATQINKALMRCLAKACAMHGLGSYVYMGEDLPVVSAEPVPETVDYAAKVRGLATWAETADAEGLDRVEAQVSTWPGPYQGQALDIINARRGLL